MPDYNITTPDGQKYKVTAPDGATQEQVLSYAQQHHETQSAPKQDQTSYTHGGLPFKSQQEPLTPQSFLDAAMIVPAGMVEGAAAKGIGMIGNAATRASPTVARMAAEGGALPLAAKTASGTAIGATGGATYNATTGRDPVTGAEIGAGIGGALPLVGAAATTAIPALAGGAKTMKEGYHARTPEALANATENIAREGDASFKEMRDAGVSLNPPIATALTKQLRSSVEEMGVLTPEIHGGTMGVLSQMEQEAKQGISVDRLHQYRKLLRGVEKKEIRQGNEEGAKAATNALNAMDEAVENVKVKGGSPEASKAMQAMQNGIKTWAKMRKFDTISDAVERSLGDPDKLKTALKKIYDSPKLSRGFTKEERAALKEASENSTGESLLKMAGKFGFDISKGVAGNKAPFWTGVGAHLMGAPSPELVALSGAGTVGRYGQKLMARGKTENLLKTIESGKGADKALGAETDPLAKRIAQ